MGANAFGYELARQFGLNIVTTKPGLVPLLLGGEDYDRYSDLAGISAEVVASANHQPSREKMLITHRGLSGPGDSVKSASYWEKGQSIQIDLAPDREIAPAIRTAKGA